MIPLIGYGHRLSVRPGETIEFKVSSQGPESFEASLVRVICADPNTEGFSHFVTSMTALAASGWSDGRVGFAPTGKAPPYHGAHPSSRRSISHKLFMVEDPPTWAVRL